MNCPLCVDQVLAPHYHDRVEIDVCPQCKGVWLDRGELDKLVSSTTAYEPPSVSHAPLVTEGAKPPKDKSSTGAKSSKKKSKKKKKSSFGDRLGDILEDVLDL